MTLDAWITVGVVLSLLGTLVFTRISADVVMAGGLTLLLVLGVLTPAEALSGLTNQGLVTVAVLYVVVAGLRETGGIGWIVQRVLGRPNTLAGAQMRVMAPVTVLSAFLNNTPVVAMFIPAVNDWCKRNSLSVSKLMIPLSYAAILGGTCTLIGTSTNLVVNGLMIADSGMSGLRMFDIAWVGVPSAAIGIAFILLMSRWLLPDRKPPLQVMDDPRSFTVEMLVEPDGPVVGHTIEQAGLRNLPGMYLAEIERDGNIMPAVGPDEKLRGGDRLLFVGIVESVKDLQKLRGLAPATDQLFKLDSPRSRRCLIEAVVSDSCPLVGKSIRDGRFRTVYNAVVIAVSRNGARIRRKVGDIVLYPGDTLLLETSPNFFDQQRDSRDFYLVSRVEDSTPPRHEKALLAVGILLAMVTVVTLGWMSMLMAAMLAAGAMIITRCVGVASARKSVDWEVLVVIGASFGIGAAMHVSGAAHSIATGLIQLAGSNPWMTLLAIYVVTSIFTEMITNNGAAVLMFYIALATSEQLGVNFTPYAVAIMMAASASFATPIGYQTNLMVYGPGGYRYTDYLRIGLPLNVIMCILTTLIAPLVWPF
ncbi:MAG: SLC13 family permease [Phycisphaeraceae bacterium]|nr:MAG: SLC13 family permease [Phycisphaeraceae bacterium]